jgi:integrase
MSIRKRKWTTRKGERKQAWVVDYSVGEGEARQRVLKTFERKKDADSFAATVTGEIASGVHVPIRSSISVSKACELWIAACRREGLEASTVAQYRQHAKHITDRIGRVRLAKLTVPAVNAFRAQLLDTMSPALARKVMVSLSSMIREAMAHGHIATNPVLGAKPIKLNGRHDSGRVKAKAGVDYPEPAEIKAFLAALPEGSRWRALFLTATFTGLRSSELRGLRWQDIDLKTGELHVRQRADRYQRVGPPKSRAGTRTIPLGPMVLNTLREWKLKRARTEPATRRIAGGDLVFPTSAGRIDRHENIARALAMIMRRAGLTVARVDEHGAPVTDRKGRPILDAKYSGLHCLRHWFASWLINPPERGGLGSPPKVAQELLGHASIAITMDRYGHLFPRGDDANERLAAAERALIGG